MTTEYFNVRNGFSVGEDTFTVEAETGDVVVGGNLTVNGTTTTLNTTQLEIEDNIIVLNKNVTGAPTLNAGIAIERGQSTDSALTWNETTDKWEQNRGGTSTVIPVNTTELVEGTNLYHTAQRAVDAVEAAGYATETQVNIKLNSADFTSTADTWLGTKSTTNLAEGTNKYYTDARVRTEINAGNPGSFVNLTASGNVELLTDTVIVGDDTVTGYQGLEFNTLGKTAHLVVDHTTGKLIYSKDNTTWTPIAQSTTELAEGTNLYYTDARVGNYLSVNSWATQEYVGVQVANLIASAPSTLNTLNELAEALGDDPNFATTVTTALGTKLATADFTSTANTWLGTKTTDNLTEGSTNRYFSNTLARGAVSAGTGVGYDSGTGVISIGQAVGTGNSPAFAGVTAGNLTVGVATDNSIVSTDTNGNITLAPNGTGNVVNTFSNGGNITNNRNYVHGAIRNATTQNTNGDIWELNTSAAQGATNPYYRGLSLDNSADTTRGPATLLRSYSGGATPGSGSRGRVIFEKARGTAASPTAVTSGDILGGMDATGYTSTGWINDTLAVVPATSFFTAAESWVSNTNLGSTYGVSLAPTATTIATSANLVPVLSVNPQTSASRSDAFTWANGKTGSTQTMSLDVSGNLIVTGDVRINGNNIQGSGGLAAIDLTSGNTLTTFRTNTALFQTAADVEYASINATGSTFICTGITNFIRTGTVNGIQPPFVARYKRSDTTGSNNGDGSQILLGTGGTSTTDNIARFDATYVTGGNHQFGIAVSSDSFSTVTNSTYKATREKTELLATPTGGGTSTVIMEVSDAKILNNRAHRNAITTGTVARGGTYSVPVTANGSISLTITAGSGITYIDVDAVAADAATGGMYSILIYNNSGDNNIDVQVRNNAANIGLANNMDAGDRAMASVYIVGDYAACEIMDAA